MSEHTPGPWNWVQYGDYFVLEDASGKRVADDGSAAGEYRGWMDSPDEPDARLIAAAPDLLAALQRCRFDSLNMSLADLEFCLAAITKATQPTGRKD